MERRRFIQNTVLSTLGASVVSTEAFGFNREDAMHSFNLKYAPHPGMFRNLAGNDIINQLKFISKQGFVAFEDNDMRKRSVEEQNAIAKVIGDQNIQMGVFVGHTIYWDKPNLSSGDKDLRNEFLNDIRASVEVAKRVNAKWMTVVPGYTDLRLDLGYQTANVVESLKKASDILESHDLVMVLEPLNFRDHPGMFLSGSSQAYEICKAVDSPACKILFDIYHQQITEGNLIPNIDACWNEIAYFQIGDNPGRKEPGTGEINYANIFRHIHSKGYRGILGMEHGNSVSGEQGEQLVIDAYRKVDSFI